MRHDRKGVRCVRKPLTTNSSPARQGGDSTRDRKGARPVILHGLGETRE